MEGGRERVSVMVSGFQYFPPKRKESERETRRKQLKGLYLLASQWAIIYIFSSQGQGLGTSETPLSALLRFSEIFFPKVPGTSGKPGDHTENE